MIYTIKITSFDVIKLYMGRETPIKANNVAALIGATLELINIIKYNVLNR